MLGSWGSKGSKIFRLTYLGTLLVCLAVGGVLVARENRVQGSDVSAPVAEVTHVQPVMPEDVEEATGESITATEIQLPLQPSESAHDTKQIRTGTLSPAVASAEPDVSTSQTASSDSSVSSQVPRAPTQMPQADVTAILYVNGSLKDSVVLPAGSTHCDVLLQAYENGSISSLNMKYYPDLKSYGVYVIDGVGDPVSIWWTYTVNGKSLPYGCSNAAVVTGDKVNWKFLK